MKKILLVSMLNVLAFPAMAGDFHLSAEYGSGTVETISPVYEPGSTFREETGDTWGIGGGYSINENFAIELLYREWEEIKASHSYMYDLESYRVEPQATQISLLASLPYNDVFSLYGRVGLARVKIIYQRDYSYGLGSNHVRGITSISGNETIFGVGALYKIGQGFGLRLEYSEIGEFEDTTLSSVTLGLVYNF